MVALAPIPFWFGARLTTGSRRWATAATAAAVVVFRLYMALVYVPAYEENCREIQAYGWSCPK